MDIYLPIAAVTQNILVLLGLGLGVGFLSGMFGVGGGFLLTPFMMFIGIPESVAVASSANQLVGSSVTGVMGYWRRGSVDFAMAGVLVAGGLVGSLVGVGLFRLLHLIGQVDLFVSLSYVLLLSGLGLMMIIESLASLLRARTPGRRRRRLHQHTWFHRLPLKMRFRRSKLYISALLPLSLGFGIGVLSAVLGVGGGFLIVPAMIYILGMPSSVVPGTSLLQTLCVASSVTILHAVTSHSVDGVLVLITLAGAVVGVHYGVRYGVKLRGEYLRMALALLMLAMGGKLIWDLTVPPAAPFVVSVE